MEELNPVLRKKIPTLAVFGNHEFESGKADQVQKILTTGGITVLDGGACEINGIGFAGIKGFSGGFGERVLEPWGESVIKRFVREAVDEALKLESALARLRTSQRIALLHYAPIAQTVSGEPPEVHPFLGCKQARRASRSLRRNDGHSRACSSRHCGGSHEKRYSSVQRRDGAHGTCLSGSPPLPDSRVACAADGALLARGAAAEFIGGRVTRNVVPVPSLLVYSIAPP